LNRSITGVIGGQSPAPAIGAFQHQQRFCLSKTRIAAPIIRMGRRPMYSRSGGCSPSGYFDQSTPPPQTWPSSPRSTAHTESAVRRPSRMVLAKTFHSSTQPLFCAPLSSFFFPSLTVAAKRNHPAPRSAAAKDFDAFLGEGFVAVGEIVHHADRAIGKVKVIETLSSRYLPLSGSACAVTETGAAPTRKVMKSTKWQPSPMIRPPPMSGSCVQWLRGNRTGIDAVVDVHRFIAMREE
jgi:hypothetical protein